MTLANILLLAEYKVVHTSVSSNYPHQTILTHPAPNPIYSILRKMKFILSTIATAALAMVASSAAIEKALPLPAHFGMYIETADSSVNGLRIQYAGGKFLFHSLAEWFN